jgi:NAD(P)-dependent dehydrogenase (short-subunit alcohol dehydrogenase family)
VAEKCAQAGAQVVITARTEKDLKDELAVLKKISSLDHQFHVLDVGDRSQVEAGVAWAKKKFGALDGLVNNAGIYGPIGPLQTVEMKEFEDAFHVNFFGTVYMCHYFIPLLEKHKGKIINYSGGGASGPFANYSAYAASKTAVVRLTENLAQELAPLGITANAVGPGFVVTRLHQQTLRAGADKAGEKFLENTKKEIERGGVPPEKAANLTVFLLSKASDGINGKFISAQWDPWEKPEFTKKLRQEKNFATLRRIDEVNFRDAKSA